MRETLDGLDREPFRPAFKNFIDRAQRGLVSGRDGFRTAVIASDRLFEITGLLRRCERELSS